MQCTFEKLHEVTWAVIPWSFPLPPRLSQNAVPVTATAFSQLLPRHSHVVLRADYTFSSCEQFTHLCCHENREMRTPYFSFIASLHCPRPSLCGVESKRTLSVCCVKTHQCCFILVTQMSYELTLLAVLITTQLYWEKREQCSLCLFLAGENLLSATNEFVAVARFMWA